MVSDERFNITFDKVALAADIYFTKPEYKTYWRAYENVYPEEFRFRLANSPDLETIERVRTFLNSWKTRAPQTVCTEILSVFYVNQSAIRTLLNVQLESPALDESVLRNVQYIFAELCNIYRLGPTGASKILGVLNPSLFVMWDDPIRKAYKCSYTMPSYSKFTAQMREAAQRVIETSGSTDITTYGIKKFGYSFPLSNYINYYLWLTFTKKENDLVDYPTSYQEQ